MSNSQPNPYNASGPVLGNINSGSQVLNHNQYGQVPLSQLPPGYVGEKQDSSSNSPMHLPTSSPQSINQIQKVNNYNQSGSSSPAFNQPGTMPPPPQPGLESSSIRPPIKTMTPSPNMFQNPLPPPDLVSSRQNVNTSMPYYPNFSKQPEKINDNTPSLTSSQYNKPIMNGPPLSTPIGSFPAQNPVQTVVSSTDVAPKVNIPPPSVANYGLGHISRPTFGQEPLGQPMSKAPTTSTISGPPLSGPPKNSPTIPGPSISSATLVNRPPLGHQAVRGLGVDVNGSRNNFAIPVTSALSTPGQPLSGPPPFGPPTTGPPASVPLRGPPPSDLSHSGLLTNGPPGPVQGLNTPARPLNQFSGQQKLYTGLSSGPAIDPHNLSLKGQQMGLYSMGSQGPQQQGMRPPTHMGPPTSLGQHGRIGTPPNMGPSTGMGPQSNMGPPTNMRPPANMGPQTSMVPSMNIGPPTNMGPPVSMGPPTSMAPLASMGPQTSMGPPLSMGAPTSMGPPTSTGPLTSMGPPLSMGPPASMGPPMGIGPPTNLGPPPSMGPQSVPPNQPQMPSGAMSNMQNRYPQMPQSNFPSQPGQMPQPNANRPYPQQYNAQGLTQQMGQLSVTKQGFDQLWGHHMVDLMQCRHILPEYPDEPPEIRLGNQFSEAPNCSPEVFRCTVNKIPDTNSLLQKSRLPLGILIHPFKDLNHLPVIQCATIVRCRACRTYINPFVYFIDSKRWKCNLCYRVNDLPEEFQYDPVSKSYGDPSRRPEVRSATIEFIAPGEYMLRPPQPAVYLFLMDVSQLARESGYIQVVCETLLNNLEQLPGDARTQVGFICYDAHVHYYLMGEGLARPKEMTVLDIDDIFLPSPESLLVNLGERREAVREVLALLPQRHAAPAPAAPAPACALGAALQAAYKLMAPTGGRITVFQTCLPNVGPGALQSREDPNARSSKDVQHLNPATDFYKRLALDCSGAQIAVDLFLLNSQYADLATLSGMSKFSGGSLHHVPLYSAARGWQAERLRRVLARYLTRKIGFEAVMRVRCTRGISIHTFHGNFFVRSTDLLSLPNVSPDAGFGMQLTIEESLSDLQHVCFQAALLYTSSKGERRIRVHTLALPVATSLTDVLHAADQQAIIGLLSKMAVDRCASASMSEAREALMTVAVDVLGAHRLAQNLPAAGGGSSALHAPHALRLLPLYLAALLKRRAFRTGTSTRLDDRVADMCALKTLPLAQLLRGVYPDLYPVHALRDHLPPPPPAPPAPPAPGAPADEEEDAPPDPPRLHLTAERLNSDGAYLLDDGETMYIYVCHAASPAFLSDTFGVTAFSQLPDEARALPPPGRPGAALLHAFVDKLNEDRPYPADVLVLRDNSPLRQQFIEKLVDDRIESTFSYYEFLQHVKSQVK